MIFTLTGSTGLRKEWRVKGYIDVHLPATLCVKASRVQWLNATVIGEGEIAEPALKC